MKGLRTLGESVGVTALGLWFGALVMTSATAGIVFPVVKKLDPRLPEFSAYSGEHWMLAAGRVMYNVFFAADVVQVTCAAFAGLALAVLAFSGDRAGSVWASRVRGAGLITAVALLVADLAWLKPQMNRALLAYWDAAKAGDNTRAEALREAFRSMHPTATALLLCGTLAVFVALIGSAWRICSARSTIVTRPVTLETPRLARAGV